MLEWWEKNFASCALGDLRLSKRALKIGKVLSLGFGKALSELFAAANVLGIQPTSIMAVSLPNATAIVRLGIEEMG